MVAELIARRHRQLIVHSYLYYELDSSLIADSTFDSWRQEMADLHRQHPEIAQAVPYYDICRQFVTSPSGFFIKKKGYPPELVAVAVRLLYYHHGSKGSLVEFVGRLGIRMVP